MNKKILSIILTLLICAGVFSGCKPEVIEGDKLDDRNVIVADNTNTLIIYSDDKLIENSDNIVAGKIVGIKVDNIAYTDDEEVAKNRVTHYTMKIEKVLKGDLEVNKKVSFIVNGDGEKFISNHIESTGGYMKKGDKVLMSLEEPEDGYIEQFEKFNKNKNVDFQFIHPLQGRIWLDENGEIDKEKNNFDAMGLSYIRKLSDIEYIMNNKDAEAQSIKDLTFSYSENELIENSENIVIGKMLGKYPDFADIIIDAEGRTQPIRIYSLQVEKVIKGNLKVGDTVKYGELSNANSSIINHYIDEGDGVVIFTMPEEDVAKHYKYINPQEYDIKFATSNTQGFIWLDENGEIDQKENNFEARNLKTIRKVADIEAMVK